ncbi:TadE/TadG family type IV pilus assembly protein [Novosphingobium tardum]|uniref:TadE/TadG family type IV pilus assembly protein n=1 Tax=Novosphingobium tardum TaxID=1538021 RepID=A0ABV8RJD4_9SPHN
MRRGFLLDQRGASAAEFALVLPIFLLFLLGMIDVGRYAWALNEAEKATQIGARWLAVTDIIPGGDAATGLKNYSFATGSSVPQGSAVDITKFPGVYCESTSTTLTCTCKGTCPFSVAIDATAQASFDAVVARMQQIYPTITKSNVRIDYDNSGLGFSGDPNGPDVAPLITVSLKNLGFPLYFALGKAVPLPSFRYAITMEDGSGTVSN